MVKRTGHHYGSRVKSGDIFHNYRWKGKSISEQALPAFRDRNPAFDARARRISDAGGLGKQGNLLRGRLLQYRKEEVPMKEHVPLMQRSVDFLYNPEQIAVNYSIDPSNFPPDTQQTEFTVPVLGTTAQTISWTLYFNRMYEVASDKTQENMGVLADIQALEYLLGSKDGKVQSMVMCMAIFGSTPKLKPFAYIGYISDLNVTYTHFSKRMIPLVASVQVGMVRRWIGNDIEGIREEVLDAGKAVVEGLFGALPGRGNSPVSKDTLRAIEESQDWGN